MNLDSLSKNYNEITKSPLLNQICDTPTLFIQGEMSAYIQDIDQPLIKNFFSDFEIKTIANAGHWVHAQKPIEFFQTVLDFLQKN